MPSAQFSINADSTNQGFDGSDGLAMTFALRSSQGVGRWVLQVFDAAAFDPAQPIEANPPRQSPGATELVLDNGSGGTGQLVTAASVVSNITSTLPSGEVSAWIVRSIVNNGVTPSGRADPALIAERIIIIPDADNLRAVPPTERTQYHDDGWTEALARILSGGGGSPSTPVSTTILTADGTMTVAPAGANFELYVTGAGSSGGTPSSEFTANDSTLVPGGGGGGGARHPVVQFTLAQLEAELPINYLVGAGGVSTAPLPVPGGVTLPGVPGDPCEFPPFAKAFGGSGNTSGSLATERAGGPGGGVHSAAFPGDVSSQGGRPQGSTSTGDNATSDDPGTWGGVGGHRDLETKPLPAIYGGGCGATVSIPAAPGNDGGDSEFGGGGGGAGGWHLGGGPGIGPASDGGGTGQPGAVSGGAAGADETDGSAGAAGDGILRSGTGGGGGGAVVRPDGVAGTAGDGGAGGIPGGGGGGGGAALGTLTTQGRGGPGGRGQIVLLGFA